MWTRHLLFFGNNSQKSQNLMLSMFCSNTLIFAPECWKCTLRYPYLKIFPGVMPPDFPSNLRFWHLQVSPWFLSGTILSFLYRQLQSFCHLLKTLLKTLFHTFNHYLLIARYYIHLARSKSETLRLNVFITFFWKIKFNVNEKLLLKPETRLDEARTRVNSELKYLNEKLDQCKDMFRGVLLLKNKSR